jgi:hypothetical protein
MESGLYMNGMLENATWGGKQVLWDNQLTGAPKETSSFCIGPHSWYVFACS